MTGFAVNDQFFLVGAIWFLIGIIIGVLAGVPIGVAHMSALNGARKEGHKESR